MQHFLSSTNKSFDVTAIVETRMIKNVLLTNNLTMNNFSLEFNPTESLAGGTLLYIANHLSYKTCFDLNIYESNELESTFIEILNAIKSNVIVGCIYKYTSIDLNEFNTNYLNNLLNIVSKEQKSVFLLQSWS